MSVCFVTNYEWTPTQTKCSSARASPLLRNTRGHKSRTNLPIASTRKLRGARNWRCECNASRSFSSPLAPPIKSQLGKMKPTNFSLSSRHDDDATCDLERWRAVSRRSDKLRVRLCLVRFVKLRVCLFCWQVSLAAVLS